MSTITKTFACCDKCGRTVWTRLEWINQGPHDCPEKGILRADLTVWHQEESQTDHSEAITISTRRPAENVILRAYAPGYRNMYGISTKGLATILIPDLSDWDGRGENTDIKCVWSQEASSEEEAQEILDKVFSDSKFMLELLQKDLYRAYQRSAHENFWTLRDLLESIPDGARLPKKAWNSLEDARAFFKREEKKMAALDEAERRNYKTFHK